MQHLSFFLIEYYTLKYEVGYWLWCFTPFSTIFELHRARGSQLYGGKPEYPKKTTDLSQVTDKFYHIMLYRAHNW